ncbi:MAG: tetratricopeptide repeat protein [Caulobacteraceae bacterium]|nr:tetratricopeptide repeat protein [Caulobacteraceae bacterium]
MSTTSASPAHLRLLGDFALVAADGRSVPITNRRARALLAYLALEPEHAAPRERVAGLLWSDRGDSQARASLRQCLLELRGACASHGLELVEVTRDRVALACRGVGSDVSDLQSALSAGAVDRAAGILTAAGSAQIVDDVEIGGLFGDWLDQTRARLEQTFARAVQALIGRLEAAADWAGVDRIAEAWLRREPLDEAVVAAAMRADAARGAPAVARKRYQALETALARELGVKPGAVARQALAALRADPAPPPAPRHEAVTPPARPSIAVLPFRNISGDPGQEYLADAITEDVTASLSRWRWFFVVASSSTFTYKGRSVEAKRVGAELGVRYVLEGSVRRAGERVRISAQLVDASNEWAVWADRFDADLASALTLQDEIVERVVVAIEPAMLQTEGARATPKALADASALDCFYRGMWQLNKSSKEGYDAAVPLFREAVTRDPELSLGHIGLARILWSGAIYGWTDRPMDDLREALAAAQTAIGLDGNDAWAHYACSGAALYLGEHPIAVAAARTAVRLNPNFALAQIRLGHVLVFAGRPQEAIAPLQRGLRLSPYDPQNGLYLEILSAAYYQSREYAKAADAAREAIEGGHSDAGFMLAISLAQMGRLDDAVRALPPRRPDGSWNQRVLAPYSNPADLEHVREGLRLTQMELPEAPRSVANQVYWPG